MPSTHEPCATDGSDRLNEVRAFLQEQGDALVNACDLLGGGTARGRAVALLCAVAEATDLPRWVERELAYINRLLVQDACQRPVGEVGTEKAPVPEEVLMLSDALSSLLAVLASTNAGSN
jgi:hypothetical protein